MTRLKWHKHRFVAGTLTPKSCQVCSHRKDAPWHANIRNHKKGIAQVLRRRPWQIFSN